MKRLRALFHQVTRRTGYFEYSVGATLILFVGVVIYTQIAPRSYITATIRLADKDTAWVDNGSPILQNIPTFTKGMKETDRFGRVTAEIINVYEFVRPNEQNIYATKKAIYVTLKLRGSYNAAANQYRYAGTSLVVGEWIRLTFRSMAINGMVVRVQDSGRWETPKEILLVKTQVKTDDSPWGGPLPVTEATGVDLYVADALHVGDMVKDSEGTILAEIIEKSVTPAKSVAADAAGNLRATVHPRKYDVFLTIRILVRPLGDTKYFLESVPVRINERLPLYFPLIHVEGRITEMLPVSE